MEGRPDDVAPLRVVGKTHTENLRGEYFLVHYGGPKAFDVRNQPGNQGQAACNGIIVSSGKTYEETHMPVTKTLLVEIKITTLASAEKLYNGWLAD